MSGPVKTYPEAYVAKLRAECARWRHRAQCAESKLATLEQIRIERDARPWLRLTLRGEVAQ